MAAADILGRSVFIRELLPQDMKVEIKKLPQEEAGKVAHYRGMVVGNAHARQMDREVRKQWKKDLQRNRAKTLETPSWLWSSIVELVASHEEPIWSIAANTHCIPCPESRVNIKVIPRFRIL